MSTTSKPLLTVADLRVHFKVRHRNGGSRGNGILAAVDGVSLEIPQGVTLGIVGESGSGKSTLARAIVGLAPIHSGKIIFDGVLIKDSSRRRGNHVRLSSVICREIQMVFQDAGGSLNPRMRIGSIVAEPLAIHRIGTRRERLRTAETLLERVGLRTADARRYPHELSGGQRQRVGIARAIALNPRLLVLDEPVSALDVSIQAQILLLLDELRRERGLTYLFVAHNLAVVRQFCDSIAVMQNGKIVETGAAEEVLAHPQHEYTSKLLASVPNLQISARPSSCSREKSSATAPIHSVQGT